MKHSANSPVGFGLRAGGGYETESKAFFTAASITDTTQKGAVNTFVKALKTANIYSKFIAIYPFVGATAAAHKLNLVDPRDLDAARRLTFSGGNTHDATGWVKSSTGRADTFIIPSVDFASGNHDLGFRVSAETTASGQAILGCRDSGTADVEAFSRSTNGLIHSSGGNNITFSVTEFTDPGSILNRLYSSRRAGTAVVTGFRNGVSAGTLNRAIAYPAFSFYLGARNSNNVADSTGSSLTFQFVFFASGLSAADHLTLTGLVAAMQTSLGR